MNAVTASLSGSTFGAGSNAPPNLIAPAQALAWVTPPVTEVEASFVAEVDVGRVHLNERAAASSHSSGRA
jgi:hypothetical protein